MIHRLPFLMACLGLCLLHFSDWTRADAWGPADVVIEGTSASARAAETAAGRMDTAGSTVLAPVSRSPVAHLTPVPRSARTAERGASGSEPEAVGSDRPGRPWTDGVGESGSAPGL